MFINSRMSKTAGCLPIYFEKGKYTIYQISTEKSGMALVKSFESLAAAKSYRETIV
jgi:3-methyladenine DNA glycosylase Mpg